MTQNDTNSFMKQTEPVNYKMETAQSMMDTKNLGIIQDQICLLYTSPSPRD